MLQIQEKHVPRIAILQYGFRPFFSLAGLSGLLLIGYWGMTYLNITHARPMPVPTLYWHAHEMLFGYAMAVIAGFLLTAVTNWTGIMTWKNRPLAIIALAWLGARLALLLPDENAIYIAAVMDNIFLTGLVIAISIPVFKARQWKQSGIIFKIMLIQFTGMLFYASATGYIDLDLRLVLHASLYLVVALVLMMLRRVLPFFVERGLGNGFQPTNRKWLDLTSMVLFLAWMALDLLQINQSLLITISVALFGLHLFRLTDWFNRDVFKKPLLWSLFAGYLSISMAFLLKAIALAGFIGESIVIHTFSVGGLGMITLGMMARATLGHTGRNVFQPPAGLATVFLIMIAAAVFRIILPIIDYSHYSLWISYSTILWALSLAGFCLMFLPMLFSPRIDGRAG
jgi:uncharacterized protein involved in response to NO